MSCNLPRLRHSCHAQFFYYFLLLTFKRLNPPCRIIKAQGSPDSVFISASLHGMWRFVHVMKWRRGTSLHGRDRGSGPLCMSHVSDPPVPRLSSYCAIELGGFLTPAPSPPPICFRHRLAFLLSSKLISINVPTDS